MFERAALARSVPFAVYIGFIFIADLLERAGVAPEPLRWLYSVKIVCVLLALWYFRRSYSDLAQGWRDWRAGTAAVALGLLVFVLWITLDADWMVVGETAGFDPRRNGVIDWRLALPRLLGATLVVPVMEELFWRSFLLRWVAAPDFQRVDPRQVGVKAFIVVMVLFGVEHSVWLGGTAAGCLYNLLYMRTRTLSSAIVAHSVTNGVLGGWILCTGNWAYW